MQERVRIFTDTSGAAPRAIETHLEDEINAWLAKTPGEFIQATQSESRGEKFNHLSVAIWYRVKE
jgi:hypothetical protein